MTDNDQLKPLANLSPAELLAGLERTEPKERGDLFVCDGILYRRLNRHYQHLGNADLIRALVEREHRQWEAAERIRGAYAELSAAIVDMNLSFQEMHDYTLVSFSGSEKRLGAVFADERNAINEASDKMDSLIQQEEPRP